MRLLKQLLLLCFSIYCISSQTFTFPADPISSEPSCGLVNEKGNWSVEGRLEANNTELVGFEDFITIRTNEKPQVCTVDLTDCGSPPPTAVDSCYCSNRTDDVYSFYVRQLARTARSSETLKALIFSTSPFSNANVTGLIGTLPVIYNEGDNYFRVDGDDKIRDGEIKLISTGAEVTVEACVDNLLGTYSVTITVAGQSVTAMEGCANITRTYDFTSDNSSYTVQALYTQMGGCNRTESFAFTLEASTSSDPSSCLEDWEIALIVIFIIIVIVIVVICICCWKKIIPWPCKNKSKPDNPPKPQKLEDPPKSVKPEDPPKSGKPSLPLTEMGDSGLATTAHGNSVGPATDSSPIV